MDTIQRQLIAFNRPEYLFGLNKLVNYLLLDYQLVAGEREPER